MSVCDIVQGHRLETVVFQSMTGSLFACLVLAVLVRDCVSSVPYTLQKLSDRSKWLDKRIDNLEIHKVTAPTGGAVYVRWGNQECAEGNDLVYAGLTAGSHYTNSGGAANFLCLPREPEFAPNQTSPDYGVAYVYGTEYEIKPLPQNDHDSVCTVCWTCRGAVLMIPAANSCPVGWFQEYAGYLMAGKLDAGRPSSEYICVDTKFEPSDQDNANNENQSVLYFTQAACGTLPCGGPYDTNKIIGCVVCSK